MKDINDTMSTHKDINETGDERRRGRSRHHHKRGGHGPGDGEFRHGRRGRAARGDVRAAVLALLAEEPMHGYQLMQAIADRTNGRWTPSPGAIYPTITQLEAEGFVTVSADAGRKLVTLTDAGRSHLAHHMTPTFDPFAAYESSANGPDLRALLGQLHSAAREIGRNGTDAQREAAADVLVGARRSLYLLLADAPDSGTE